MSFEALTHHAVRLEGVHLRALFAADPNRVPDLRRSAAGLTADFSKQAIDAEALAALYAYAEARGVATFRDRMLAGDIVNPTEARPALHVALRGWRGAPEAAAAVAAARAQCEAFAAAVRADPEITACVHLGIGGSFLGPKLVLEALKGWARPGFEVRFAANVDGADLVDALEGLDPRRTLVSVVSKTFTTIETMTNAAAARAWLADALAPEALARRLIAVTAAPQRAVAWGVPEAQVFPFWDWVGGRFSVWSAVGLTAELALEPGAFTAFLAAAAEMDQHFAEAPPEANLPLTAALIQFWNRRLLGAASYAMIPYSHRLRSLPMFLQQLEMESNGKGVDLAGAPLPAAAAGVTWGAPGTDAQHSFFQLLHQGRDPIPLEILILRAGHEGPAAHGRLLLANALAQAEALMAGKTAAQAEAELLAQGAAPDAARALAPHKAFPGNRPSTLIALERLAPDTLGALLAFYEHRTVAQAALDGVNPFDQWGVELGKQLATGLAGALDGRTLDRKTDPSTAAWLAELRTEGGA